jgi:hypothetical protein
MSTGYEGGFTRRQELTCTETEMAAYADVVLYQNEHIYIKMNSGMIRLKIGDGKTGLLNLPWAKVFDATLDDVEAIVGGFASRVETNTNRIENLEAAISPEIVTPVTDSTVAYTKTVPKGALPNAAITEIGGMSYVKNGVLVDSKVEAVESVSTNLWSGEISAKSAPTAYSFNNGTMTLKRNGGGIPAFIWSAEKFKAGAYKLSFTLSGVANSANFRIIKNSTASATNIGTNITSVFSNTAHNISFTLAEDSYLGFGTDVENVTLTASNIMLNRGATALPYSPYFRESLPIPGDALDGFRQGVNKDYCNKIVLDPMDGVKKYVKMVKKIELNGTESMSAQNYAAHFTVQQFNISGLSNIKNGIDVLCNEAAAGWNAFTGNANEIGVSNGYIVIGIPKAWLTPYGYIDGTSSTYASSFKAYLKAKYDNGTPMTVAYAIATTVETDVSALFTDDNRLPVEAGGTITAVNEYEQAVPFTVKYMIKGA